MENTSWLRQSKEQPAFYDRLWNQPETKSQSGKLMIAGGHAQSFAAPSKATSAAYKAGVGSARVVLPDSLRKTVGGTFFEAEFAISTPIGSFSRKALEPFLDLAAWSDAVLLAGDFGRNSETAVLINNFIIKYTGRLCLIGDALDYFFSDPPALTQRPDTVAVATLSQLQKLASPKAALKQNSNLAQLIKQLNQWSLNNRLEVITAHSNQIIVSLSGRSSTTAGLFSLDLATYASVWRLQQPDKPFESLTSAVYCYVSSNR